MHVTDRQEAKGLLRELSEIQSTTRGRLYACSWQWMVIWSVAFLGAALTGVVPAWQRFAGAYWLGALPVSLVLTAVVSSRFESRSPVRRRATPYWIMGLGITLGNTAVSLLLPEPAIVVAIWVILGFGFAAFSWLDRVKPASWLLASMAVVSGLLGLVVEDTFQLYPALAFAFSAALAGIVVGMRIHANQ